MVAMQDYRIQLDAYSGPMDLLLYLIRREEVDIYDIPIARILEQYLGYVTVLKGLDPEAVGDFLVMAATLMEIKSRMLLPTPPAPVEEGGDWLDPRADLVRQLLEYRSVREAAARLGRRADEHALRFNRPTTDLGGGDGTVDIENVQLWDLLAAFNKIMSAVAAQRTHHEVKYDDTPIALHAEDILDRLQREEGSSMRFEQVFEGQLRPRMIGLFLALLELIRQKRVRVEQDDGFGSIMVHLLDATPISAEADVPVEEQVESSEVDEELPPARTAPPVKLTIPDTSGVLDDDDEYLKQIDSIEVGDLDLARGEEETDEPHAEL